MSSERERPEAPEHLGRLIKRIQHGHHRALDAAFERLGLSLVQWSALREIERNPGCSQHRLATCTFNSDQALGTLVTRLMTRGLVARRPGVGRAAALRLTATGKTLWKKGEAIMSDVLAGSFASLRPKERAELARLLTKILDANDAAD